MADNKSMTVLEQIKKLDEQRAALLDNAKAEALTKVNSALETLNSLGFTYSLSETAGKPKSKKPVDPTKPCSYCGKPGHDARFHRAEIIAKKKAEAAKNDKKK